MFVDTKRVMKSCKSMDRQHNDQKKNKEQNNTQKTKD